MASKPPIPGDASWPVVSLADVCLKIGSGATPRGGSRAYFPTRTTFALVRSQNVFDRRFSTEGLAFISDEQARGLRGVQLQPEDILLNITGDGVTFGRSCYVPESVLPACVNQHVAIVRVNPAIARSAYVLSYLTAPIVKEYMESFNTGGSRRALTKGHIESFSLHLPPMSVQEQIGEMLVALDQRIENFERQNETLEAIARAIFRSWFVDFDPVRAKADGREPEGMDAATADLFPNAFEDTSVGAIPSGWKVVSIGDIASLDKGLSYKGDFLAEAGMPMINLGCFTGDGGFDSEKLKFYTGDFKGKHVVRSGDLVIANTDITQKRIVIGSPAIVPPSESGEYLFTHHTFALRPTIGLHGLRRYLYFTLLQPSFRERAIGFATGTTVLALPRDAVLAQELLLPDGVVLAAFSELVDQIANKIDNNLRQSKVLAELRDTLLPRLISGKLRVPEAEQMVEAVL